jgi:hypothetical protein
VQVLTAVIFTVYGTQCRNNLLCISESDKIKDDFKGLSYNIKTYVLKSYPAFLITTS